MAKFKKADFFSVNEFIQLTGNNYPFDEFAEVIRLRAEMYIVNNNMLEWELDNENVTAEILNNFSTYESDLINEPKLLMVCKLLVQISDYKITKFKNQLHQVEQNVFDIIKSALGACEYSQGEKTNKGVAEKRELIRKAATIKKQESGKNNSWIANWLVRQIKENRKAYGYSDKEKIPSAKTLLNEYINGLT